ncbi:MAG: MAE_28990/MAE_18760 family HEPN-like nuclease [Planctomycetota bacterium]
MIKIHSASEHFDFTDAEFAWRLKEIADVRGAIRAAAVDARKSLLRAAVPILYAHWEGFIKVASEAVLSFLSTQRHTYRELNACFIAFGAKKHIHLIKESNNPVDNVAVVEFFLNQMNTRANITFTGAVVTGANLSSAVFTRIAKSIGVNTANYESRYQLIDSSLLERRNTIAHGEYLDVDSDDFDKLANNVLEMMRWYKNDVQNLVQTKVYLSP